MAPDPHTVRRLYRKLLGLYPRPFREQLGVSMEQTFADLYHERLQQPERGTTGFLVRLFAETALGILRERLLHLRRSDLMKALAAHPTAAALLGLLLALPFLALLTLAVLDVDPPVGPYDAVLPDADPDRPDVLGSLLALGTVVLALVAFFLARAPIVRTRRAGGSLFAHPANLLLAGVIVSFLVLLAAGLIVDQYPCWTGTPNCD